MHAQEIRRALGLADRKKDRVLMQIQTEIALPTVFTVVRHHHAFIEAALDVVAQLRAAVVSRWTKIAPLMLVPQQLAVALVIGEAVKTELEFDRQRLTGNVEGHFERLKVGHAFRCAVDDQVIPLHGL